MASNVSSNFEALVSFAANPFPSFRKTTRQANADSSTQRVATQQRVAAQANPVAGNARTVAVNPRPRTPSSARAPLMTVARWQPAAANSAMPVDVEKTDSIRRRTPTVTAPAATTPNRTVARPMTASLDTSDEADEAALEFISLARDSRPDDVREALNDFRAMLIATSWDE